MKDLVAQKTQALRREADATVELADTVTHLDGYQDGDGKGPKEDSLKGIRLTVNRRIKAQFGATIKEMDPDMLDAVSLLKRDLARLVARMMTDKAEYPEMKRRMWALIERSATAFFDKRAA